MSSSPQDVSNDTIKTMKLYTNVERIQREVTSRFGSESVIDPIALSEIDCMHYQGNDAIEDVIQVSSSKYLCIDRFLASIKYSHQYFSLQNINLNSSSKVLDVGSGFAGVARMLAAQSKCTTVSFMSVIDSYIIDCIL